MVFTMVLIQTPIGTVINSELLRGTDSQNLVVSVHLPVRMSACLKERLLLKLMDLLGTCGNFLESLGLPHE